jgi:hypothetical protein
MWRNTCAALIVTAVLLTGCNKESDDTATPAVPDKPALPEGVKPRPTTQELQGRIKLDLKYDPLTMMVPSSWELKSMGDGSMIVVEGYTPHDMVGISLPVVRVISNERLVPASVKISRLEAEARAEAAKHPELVKGDVVRDITGAHVVEQITVDPPVPATTQETGAPTGTGAGTGETVQTMQWIITVCVPSGADFKAYELRFQGLTVKTYVEDHDFLRSIIDSISYNPPAPDSLLK